MSPYSASSQRRHFSRVASPWRAENLDITNGHSSFQTSPGVQCRVLGVAFDGAADELAAGLLSHRVVVVGAGEAADGHRGARRWLDDVAVPVEEQRLGMAVLEPVGHGVGHQLDQNP